MSARESIRAETSAMISSRAGGVRALVFITGEISPCWPARSSGFNSAALGLAQPHRRAPFDRHALRAAFLAKRPSPLVVPLQASEPPAVEPVHRAAQNRPVLAFEPDAHAAKVAPAGLRLLGRGPPNLVFVNNGVQARQWRFDLARVELPDRGLVRTGTFRAAIEPAGCGIDHQVARLGLEVPWVESENARGLPAAVAPQEGQAVAGGSVHGGKDTAAGALPQAEFTTLICSADHGMKTRPTSGFSSASPSLPFEVKSVMMMPSCPSFFSSGTLGPDSFSQRLYVSI